MSLFRGLNPRYVFYRVNRIKGRVVIFECQIRDRHVGYCSHAENLIDPLL